MRKIAVITGTRAEYGLLYWVIKGIQESPELELQLIVTGMHLVSKFGSTIKEIENDDFLIAAKVDMKLISDSELDISSSIGVGITEFAKVYERIKPDILLVLGDRFEILSAVSAAVPFRMPIAHIHGGESTEGLIDESIRHAVTKMSHIHFVSTEKYRKKVIQMGELPENVFCFGAPGIDNIHKLNLMEKKEICDELKIANDRRIGVCTYHPVTLEENTAESQINEILEAVRHFDEISWVFTAPNADTHSSVILRKIKDFVNEFPNKARLFSSLGQLKYLSLLKNASIMIGNSSSGLIEAPSFGLPVVNIGDRQRGRVRARNVIDVRLCKEEAIVAAINKAASSEFANFLGGIQNPYGDGHTSEKIVEKLRTVTLGENLIKKRFHEITQ